MKALLFALLGSILATTPVARAGTTIITHGFELGDVPTWAFTMAEAVLRADGDTSECGSIAMQPPLGTVFLYDPASGDWLFECGSPTPNGEIVLVFDWSRESDGINLGGTQGYAEAAADALYASLRDPVLPQNFSQISLLDGPLHFIGHSRGTVVNSDCVERLTAVGIGVDHVTTLDPHPVDGTLDFPTDFADWGDRAPVVWVGVDFTDNYWRADGGGIRAIDFDGMPIGADIDLDLGAAIEGGVLEFDPPLEHTEVHAWYFGTIDLLADDDDAGTAIDDESTNWWGDDGIPDRDLSGFYHSAIVGGPRPAQVAGQDPSWSRTSIYNGDFEIVDDAINPGVGYAGWLYHGGDRSGLRVAWSSSEPPPGSDYYLELSGDTDRDALTHNRVFVDDSVTHLQMSQRVIDPSPSDRFRVTFASAAGDLGVVDQAVDVSSPWQTVAFPVPAQSLGASWAIRFEIDGGGDGIESRVAIDDLRFVPEPRAGALIGVSTIWALRRRRRARPVSRRRAD